MKMKLVTRKRYSKEFKAQAVELVRNGKPVPELAQELEISSGMLYKWVRQDSQAAQVRSEGLQAVGAESVAEELRRLRRQNAQLQMENDILKKAAVIMGTRPRNNDAS